MRTKCTHASLRPCALIGLLVLLIPFLCLVSCKKKTTSASQNEPPSAPKNALELVFTYGSEKEKWISEVTDQFNREGHRTASGRPIVVRAIAMGSGELIDEVLSGRRQPHIIRSWPELCWDCAFTLWQKNDLQAIPKG